MQIKTCRTCGQNKELSFFYSRIGKKETHRTRYSLDCKLCACERQKARGSRDNQLRRQRYATNVSYRESKLLENRVWASKNTSSKVRRNKLRKSGQGKATPKWLTNSQKEEILQFYWLAKDLQSVSGEKYHVDHIVPLNGVFVCGLHVPWNLQVLPADINLSKGNSVDLIKGGSGCLLS